MRDFLENLESGAERRMDDIEQLNGMWKCSCGKLYSPGDAQPSSPNPYCDPICPQCFAEKYDNETGNPNPS